jgi:hypothetical protein
MSVVTQPHNLPSVDGENGEELAVQLNPGKLFARFIVDSEDDMFVVGDEFERVDLVRAGRAGAQPGEYLVASPAGDRAGDVYPGDVEVEMVGERVDVAAAQRVDPVEHEFEVGFCLVEARRYLRA